MKIGLIFGSVIFLIAGISPLGNPLEVTGQNATEEAMAALRAASNAGANDSADAIKEAEDLLSSVQKTDAVKKAHDGSRGTPNATTNRQLNETSQTYTYENVTLGISFQYPSNWREMIPMSWLEGLNPDALDGVSFFVAVPKLDTATNTSLNSSKCGDNEPKDNLGVTMLTLKMCDAYKMNLDVYELDKPNRIGGACNCNTLKDFVTWDYTRADKRNTFINDNQTIIGSNHSAWQMEEIFSSSLGKEKWFRVWAINDNFGYRFLYQAPADARFDGYLDGFKNMLKSVAFSPPTPEKKPSFLNSSEISNLPASATEQAGPVKILSSNDFIDSIGYLHVVGEIENTTPANIQFVKVTGTFYDSNNQVVATDFTYTNPSDIGSGQKAPFELLLTSASIPISRIDHYNLVASYD